MTEQDRITFIDRLLAEKNYLSAYLCLKETSTSREVQLEYTGRIAQDILNEIGNTTGRRNKEKIYFYRSLLIMIGEDIPGFARIYKRQLRLSQEPESPLAFLKHLKVLAEGTQDKSELQESIEDSIADISEKIEDTAENISEGRLDDSVKDILTFAEDSIVEGLKGFNLFLKKITQTPGKSTPLKQKEDVKLRKAEPVDDNKNNSDKEEGTDRKDKDDEE